MRSIDSDGCSDKDDRRADGDCSSNGDDYLNDEDDSRGGHLSVRLGSDRSQRSTGDAPADDCWAPVADLRSLAGCCCSRRPAAVAAVDRVALIDCSVGLRVAANWCRTVAAGALARSTSMPAARRRSV